MLWMVAGQAMRMAIIGEVVGLAATLAPRRVLETQIYGATMMDAEIYAAVPLVLAAVAFMAALIPARRAMNVDPLIALRRE